MSIFADLRVWGMPVEERRKPIHGGLAAAKHQGWHVVGQCRSNCRGAKFCPCCRYPR
ncbi:protein of unknown function [Methylotuvimicrobium alcaliphilum 20Z]|uniref:Uncharacterized protein n=1 Tax=Methylotuvimicrobium alcaliphilum (strain DSM 19304 / NCIMB 14124 / VKM B-2133 / 20Z) TaxID=1091494 RepID=G4T0P6_META2|nr:protein of unknown function [Methylotuvimicrobium alcaliphilum 20Z]